MKTISANELRDELLAVLGGKEPAEWLVKMRKPLPMKVYGTKDRLLSVEIYKDPDTGGYIGVVDLNDGGEKRVFGGCTIEDTLGIAARINKFERYS